MITNEMEDLLNRFEDRREIKNLIGKYVNAVSIRKDAQLWDLFWAKEQPDVSLGFNDGFYYKKEAIVSFYNARQKKIMQSSKIMQSIFPKELGSLSDKELYGVGVFEQKPVQNAYIVVAGDRKTAKGLWAINGCFADITTAGPTASWIWAYLAADFIMEKDEWRIWHMQYLEDINSRCGVNWVKENEPLPDLPEFASLSACKIPEKTVKQTLWTPWAPKRSFAGTPKIPVPYETFSDTFSYGI